MKPDIFDEFDKKFVKVKELSRGTYYFWKTQEPGEVKDWIQANFISKASLKEMIDQVKYHEPESSTYKYYNQALDDILKLL